MLLQYAAERLRPVPLLTATCIVSCAATLLSGWRGLNHFAADFALALALLIHFRAWDDINDRERDSIRHPERVTVRAPSLSPLAWSAALIGVGCAASLVVRDGASMSLAMLLVMWVAFAAWYRCRGARTAWADHLLMTKYPMFVIVVSGAATGAAPTAAGPTLCIVYLTFCVYEAWHDRDAPWRRIRIAIEAPLLGSVVLLSVFRGGVS